MVKIACLAVLLLMITCSALWATPTCTSDPLSVYLSSGYSCGIGSAVFSNFGFERERSGTSLPWLSPSQITVTPSVHDEEIFFTFTGPFTLPAGTAGYVVYKINYTLDGTWIYGNDSGIGPVTTGLVVPYSVSLTEDKCIGGSFSYDAEQGDWMCVEGTPQAIQITTSNSNQLIWFVAPSDHIEVRDRFEIISSTSGQSGVDYFENSFAVPEPWSLILVGSGLLGLGLLRRRFR